MSWKEPKEAKAVKEPKEAKETKPRVSKATKATKESSNSDNDEEEVNDGGGKSLFERIQAMKKTTSTSSSLTSLTRPTVTVPKKTFSKKVVELSNSDDDEDGDDVFDEPVIAKAKPVRAIAAKKVYTIDSDSNEDDDEESDDEIDVDDDDDESDFDSEIEEIKPKKIVKAANKQPLGAAKISTTTTAAKASVVSKPTASKPAATEKGVKRPKKSVADYFASNSDEIDVFAFSPVSKPTKKPRKTVDDDSKATKAPRVSKPKATTSSTTTAASKGGLLKGKSIFSSRISPNKTFRDSDDEMDFSSGSPIIMRSPKPVRQRPQKNYAVLDDESEEEASFGDDESDEE